jgi:hypothetical protein
MVQPFVEEEKKKLTTELHHDDERGTPYWTWFKKKCKELFARDNHSEGRRRFTREGEAPAEPQTTRHEKERTGSRKADYLLKR